MFAALSFRFKGTMQIKKDSLCIISTIFVCSLCSQMIVDVEILQQPTPCYKNSTEECEGNWSCNGEAL